MRSIISFVSCAVLVLALAVVVRRYPYPDERVCADRLGSCWFEIFTDGHAPDWVAEDARVVLSRLWRRVFDEGHVERSGVVDFLVAEGVRPAEKVRVVELAAGTGFAARSWRRLLERRGVTTDVVLTDAQPMVDYWEETTTTAVVAAAAAEVGSSDNSGRGGTVSYASHPVNATELPRSLRFGDGDGDDEVVQMRAIHLALHHFDPQGVEAVFREVVDSNAVLVVGDLVPSLSNVILQSQWGLLEFLADVPRTLREAPWKALLTPLAPLLVLSSWHDAAVSVARSYSVEQLERILSDVVADAAAAANSTSSSLRTNKSQYTTRSFRFFTFSDLLGIPRNKVPFLDSEHLQFFVAVPRR